MLTFAHRGMETNQGAEAHAKHEADGHQLNAKPNETASSRSAMLRFGAKGMESNIAPALLRKRELAKLLNVCPRTIENLMRAGLPHLKPSSRLVLFNGDDALGWFKERFATKGRPSSYQPRVRQAEEGAR